MPILCSIEPQTTGLRAPSEPSSLTRTFGTRKSEMPLVPAGAPSMRARTRWMMVSAKACSPGEKEDFLAGEGVRAVRLLVGARLDEAEVGAALRLGQVHRAGPFAGRHLRQVFGLQRVVAMHLQRRGRAVGEAGIHRKGEIRGDRVFAERNGEK